MIVQLAFGLTFIAITAMNVMALLPGIQDVINLTSVQYELDPIWELYEVGNDHRMPETADEMAKYCAIRGIVPDPTSKIMMNIVKTNLWMATLKPGVAVTAGLVCNLATLPKINWICQGDAWKAGIIVNQYANQAKQLKSAFTKHMWDLIIDGPQRTTWAHWLCICRKYINEVAVLHPETDRTREGVMGSLAGHLAAISAFALTTATTPDPVCDIQPPKLTHDKYPLTSYTVAYSHGMNLFYKDPVTNGVNTALNTAQGLAINLGGAGILGGKVSSLGGGKQGGLPGGLGGGLLG